MNSHSQQIKINSFFFHILVDARFDAIRSGLKNSEFVQENPLNSSPLRSRMIISTSAVRGVSSTLRFLNCSSKFSANLGSVFKRQRVLKKRNEHHGV